MSESLENIRAELASCDSIPLPEFVYGMLVQRYCLFRKRSFDERRPVAVTGVSVKRELRNNEDLPGNIGKRKIHFAFLILKHTEA